MKCPVCSKEDCTDFHSAEEHKAATELREALRTLIALAKKLEE